MQQIVENEKLSQLHKHVFDKYQNSMGKRMCTEFQHFLQK